MRKSWNKIYWYPDELLFIKKNFRILSASKITEYLNKNRLKKFCIHSVRVKMYELGCNYGRIPEWTAKEVKFLVNNYKTIGNIELAVRLNGFKNPSRIFNKKTIEKKMNLLKIYRTDQDLLIIKEGHKKQKHYGGRPRSYPIGKISIIRTHNGKRYYIKIDSGKLVPYARILYKSTFGPIPVGMVIRFKDGNPMNCKPENLYAGKRGIVKYKLEFKPIPDSFFEEQKTHSSLYIPSYNLQFNTQTQ
jgi:hypothetical protein